MTMALAAGGLGIVATVAHAAPASTAVHAQLTASGSDTPYQPNPFGTTPDLGIVSLPNLNAPVVGMAADPSGTGAWMAATDGGLFAVGGAPYLGSLGNVHLNAPIVGIAAHDGGGYWMVASDGGVFEFGDAHFYGSLGGVHLNAPIVGIVPTPDGHGYWLVASDGGVFEFGDALFYGSLGNVHLNAPIVGMAATSTGGGYWMVASDGGVFEFGDAHFYGSLGDVRLNAPIVGMAAAHDSDGYWLVGSDGGVFEFGDAPFYGSMGGDPGTNPVIGLIPTVVGTGYWLLTGSPRPVPGVPVLGRPYGDFFQSSQGFGLVAPNQIYNGGDPTGDVTSLTWSSWGGPTATGTGNSVYVAPNQSVAQGTSEPATVVAFNRGDCDGIYMYQAVEWYFPQHGQTFNPGVYENICNGSYVGE
jgi:hypothetical protein